MLLTTFHLVSRLASRLVKRPILNNLDSSIDLNSRVVCYLPQSFARVTSITVLERTGAGCHRLVPAHGIRFYFQLYYHRHQAVYLTISKSRFCNWQPKK